MFLPGWNWSPMGMVPMNLISHSMPVGELMQPLDIPFAGCSLVTSPMTNEQKLAVGAWLNQQNTEFSHKFHEVGSLAPSSSPRH